jgi:uncharacterized protein YbjQ (UPF0145 family)
MYQARRTAVDRMTAHCAALGGHGVVGVLLSRGPFVFGGVGFTVAGTAVRAAGNALMPPRPFVSAMSGQDFARLVRSGWIPAGLVHGIAIGVLHDDRTTVRQARPWSGNAEMTGWTTMVNRARQGARRRLEDDIRRLGAEGAVIADMRMHARVRDCPVAVGRRDHIVEVTLIGTAIVSFSRADCSSTGPVVTVTPLGTPPYQARREPLGAASPGMPRVVTDNHASGAKPPDKDPAEPYGREPDSSQFAEEDPGYLTQTGETVGEDGSVVPIIGGLPAVEGSSWDIGAPTKERGAGLAEEEARSADHDDRDTRSS